MNIGDVVKVYNLIGEQPEPCDHNAVHVVPIYEVKRITITGIRQEPIKALHYTHDGIGEVLYATDAQGRMYRKQAHWDGPRASVWVRIPTTPGGKVRTFTQYPTVKFSRDILGNSLHLERH
jgi:hypothetical protein